MLYSFAKGFIKVRDFCSSGSGISKENPRFYFDSVWDSTNGYVWYNKVGGDNSNGPVNMVSIL